MDEIASKWQTYSDVQKSGITTALAGTRQRENVLTMFENYDLVKKYEQIAANSYGTAAQKMEAYTDSVEAARQRITNSVEKFVLALNSSTLLKGFYNIVADLTSNLTALSTAVVAFLLLFRTTGTVQTFMGGLGSIQQKIMNFSLNQIKAGQYRSYNSQGGRTQASNYWANIKNTTNEAFVTSQKEYFSKSMNQTIDGLTNLQDSTKTLLKDGMIPLQNTFVDLTQGQKEVLAETLLNKQGLTKQQMALQLSVPQLMSNTSVEAILGTVTQERREQLLRQIATTNSTITDEQQLQAAMQDETVRRQAAGTILAEDTPDQVREELGRNIETSSQMTFGQSLKFSALAVGGTALGGGIGGLAGSVFGDGGTTIGTSLGAVIANAATSSMISQMAQGSTLWTALKSVFGAAGKLGGVGFGLSLVTAAVGVYKKHKASLKKKAAEEAKEVTETYNNQLSASASAVSFDKLVTGVDYLGRNISLTDEEYQQFLDSSNALAEAFPELVVRVDEFGNKLVGPNGLDGKVGAVTDRLDEMLETSKKAADIAMFKTDSGVSGFSNVFDEQYALIKEARNGINNKIVNGEYHGTSAAISGYDFQIKSLEDALALDRENGWDTTFDEKQLEAFKKERDELIKQQEAYEGQIREAGSVLTGYLDNLISYASTDTGSVEFNRKYDDLYDSLNSMGEEASTLINQVLTQSFDKIEFENEAELKDKLLSLSSELNDLMKSNPQLIDVYFGEGEFATLGDQKDAMEKMIPVLEQIFGEGGYDKTEQAIIEKLGLKVVIDGDKTEIVAESLGETFTKKFDKEVSQVSIDRWDRFISGLTQDQYKKLNSLQEGGWIDNSSVRKPKLLKKLIGADEYQTTDLQILSNRYLRKKGEGWWNENGQTDAGDVARSVTDQFMNDLNSNPDEGVSIADYLLDKKDIAKKFADYGQDWMERFDALQTQLADDVKDASPEEIQKAVNDFTKQIDLEAGLQEQINALAPLTEAAASQLFSSIDVEGYIDTWKELSDAFESIQKSYDDLAEAQAEQKQQGHLQVQTVLDLLSTDENYIQALEVEGEQIKLKTNAEEIMNEVKLRAIQLSLQQKIAEDELAKAQIESELRAAYAGDTYTKVADETVTATDNKITAFQAESDALAQVTNDYLTLAQAETLANKAKLATDVGSIAAVEKGISGFKSNTSVKSTQIKHVDKSQIDYSGMDDEERQARINSLEAQLKNYAGNFTYDEKTGQFSYELDDQGHYTEGSLGVRQHLEQDLGNLLKKGASGTNFDKMYKSLAGSSKDAKDSVNDLLKALDSLIDKEWEAMEVWDEDNQKSTGYTAYFEKKRASLEKLAAVAKSKMDSSTTEEERADAEKDYIEYQKQINNLDDEEIEDKYNLLELQGASLDKLIAMQKVYIQTSDTEEENVERNKKLKELLQDQLSLHREISEWQRDNTDRLIDRLSGDAFGNKAYDMAISQQIEAVTDEMNTTQNKINQYYAQAVEGYEKTGSTHAEALRLAYTGNSEASENLRSEMTKYYDLIDKRTEYTIKKLEDKADDLNRRMELLEKEKPDQWFKIGDIDSYYTQRMDLLQNQIALYEDALKDTSNMTDEQIQNIVDSLNEATLNLKQAQIDNLKDQTDLQSTQYDAIVYRINLWKDEIQDAIDAIEKAYEDEIKPIQDINDELERQGKLEDLLAAKKAAAKEKERVFRQGIGWVTDKCTPTMDYIG